MKNDTELMNLYPYLPLIVECILLGYLLPMGGGNLLHNYLLKYTDIFNVFI